MKTSVLLTLGSLLFLGNLAQAQSFNCSNAPAVKWGTYVCASGEISADGKTIANLAFGTCEGSESSGEAEPVDIFDFDVIQHNPALAAKSQQWKNAGAFDVSTELGNAVLYYVPGSDTARLKINNEDIRLRCF
ncbi:hypothetical protein [Bdellovibrio sp. HCB274]|uniref:hypothetical protein n=1 Tax=Bdellovibrio sp. HCB274 TaxID=3394361 RepID=UPI0039B5923E